MMVVTRYFSSANGEVNKCNCDLKEWDGVDHGIITGTHNLPVQQLLFGDSDGPYRKKFKIIIESKTGMLHICSILYGPKI